MSRRRIAALIALAAMATAPAVAQDGATGSPPERIDLTVRRASPSTEEECRRRTDSAVVSGEIVVCGALPSEDQRITSRREAQERHAARTMNQGTLPTPDVAGPGIFRGPATFGGICVKGVFNCPKPPALFVDVTKLPQAPPGSDADRIARGLAPLGDDGPTPPRPMSVTERAELGLPEPNPAESAAPAAPQ